ncbi:MAG: hypothetical protein FJW86_12540 [Actinobacteria bacterium]|nr:hypothetical protein [Actinomycetota bacterium]
MPVPPDQIATMLGPMRDQLAQAEADGAADAAPTDFADARAALDQMEALAAESADMGEWSQVLARDGWWQRFTDPYTRALVAVGEKKYGGAGGAGAPPDDATMLANMVGVFEQSITQLAGNPDEAHLVPVLREVVDLGKSGLSFPRFLRELELRGINQQMLGLSVQRHHLEAQAQQARDLLDPAREQMATALVAAYDGLAGRNELGVVDPLEFELARLRVEHEWAPVIARQDYVAERTPLVVFLLIDWIDAHTSWAPKDERFLGDNAAQTKENIERTQQCNPGFVRVRLDLLSEAIGLDFPALFDEPIFPQVRKNGGPYFSDERVDIARALEPACTPGASPPDDLLARAAAIGPNS